MAVALGANRFFAYKSQTAHGTKASGFTTSMVPLRNGSIFKVNPILKARADAINVIPPFSNYYPVPKVVGWQAAFYLTNPTTAHVTVRDLLRTMFGRETLVTGPPITKTYDWYDPVIDGGTDTGTVLYGRCLTLHEQSDKSDGTAIYAHEVQDAVMEELKITWTPTDPVMIEMSGLASDLLDGQTDITPSYPDGSLFHWQHVRDTTTAGLRIGTANPPTATDNVIFSKAMLTVQNKMRYLPFLGNGTTKQVRQPARDDQTSVTLDVTMDVEDAVASQYESAGVITDWKNGAAVNLDFLTYIDANNILDLKASAATKSCFWETFEQTAQGYGAMQFAGTLRFAPAALADSFIKLTTFS